MAVTDKTANAIELKRAEQSRVAKLTKGNGGPGISSSEAPLSFAQQQIWLHAQLVPQGSPVYNEPVTIHRHGKLDVSVLERVLTEIVRRHEAWRTTFSRGDGEPVQVIQPVTPVL